MATSTVYAEETGWQGCSPSPTSQVLCGGDDHGKDADGVGSGKILIAMSFFSPWISDPLPVPSVVGSSNSIAARRKNGSIDDRKHGNDGSLNAALAGPGVAATGARAGGKGGDDDNSEEEEEDESNKRGDKLQQRRWWLMQ